MSKLIFTFMFSTIAISSLIACTFEQKSFCLTASSYQPNDIVISGIITHVDTLGINLDVIHVLRGENVSSNIRIWDGTDFDCNGILSMAAADIGMQNDTVILILPIIDSMENVWDVIGDYRRPDPYALSTSLTVSNGIANGLLKGWYSSPWSIRSYSYDDLIENWTEECDNITSSSDLSIEQLKCYPNPAKDILVLESLSKEFEEKIKIVDLQGIVVQNLVVRSDKAILDISSLRIGMYAILNENNRIISKFSKH